MKRDSMRRCGFAFLAASLLVVPVFSADPASLVPQRAARIDSVLQRYTDENRIAGAVALVLRDGKPVYEKAFGYSDREPGVR